MAEPTLELLCAQVEVALEEGDLAVARRLLDDALARFPGDPRPRALETRLAEVARLAGRSTLGELTAGAQERLRAADYPAALDLLRRAVALAPGDGELLAMVERTERAADRHRQAVERRREMAAATADIAAALDAGDLQAARQRLETARGRFGREKALDALDGRLQGLVEQDRAESARQHVERARRAAAAADWHGALHQAELAETLHPGQPEAAELLRLARGRIESAAGAEQRRRAVDEARADVERLVDAGEMARADVRLRQAVDDLGRDPVFERLAAAIDEAKKDRDFKRRFEWRERRAKEAEALVAEGTRRALGGDFATAVAKLEAARELDPTHPDLEAKLATHRAALERHRALDAQQAALEGALAEIRGHLEALRLGEAAAAIAGTRRRFGDDPRLAPLLERLDGLRGDQPETEDPARTLPTPANLPRLGLAARAAIARQQRAAAAAYSWRQAFTYPFRGAGPALLGALTAAIAAVNALALALGGLDVFTPLIVAVVAPGLLRSSLEGGNLPPAAARIGRVGTARDGALTLGLLLLAAAPAVVLLATRRWHGLFELGPAGFLVFCLLLWAGGWWASAAVGVAFAFGAGHALRPRPAIPGATLLAVSAALFAVLAGALWIRIATVPVMAVPLAAFLAAYGLVVVPHLVGVMVRARRLEWASSYGP